MSMRAELERLQNGELSPEQQAELFAEIEKHEAIGEYLADRFDQEFRQHPNDPVPAKESRRIARRVNFRLMGYALLMVAVVVAAVALWAGYCDAAYYNPNKGIEQTYGGDGQFGVDMAAFTELHSPGYVVSAAEANRDGPGSYLLRIRQNDLFSGQVVTTTERLVRGELLSAGDNTSREYWRFPMGNAFGYRRGVLIWADENGVEHRTPDPEQLAWQKEALSELPSSSQAAAYVTFSSDLSLDEFADFWQRCHNAGLYPSFAAVVIADGYQPRVMGFEPFGSGIVMENVPDEEQYPYFELGGRSSTWYENPAPVWEAHFRSLLRYLSQRPDFLETMANVNGIDPLTYQEALSYLDQNGVQIYGALVHGSADQILQMVEQEKIEDLFVSDVKLSVFSR